MVAKKLSSTTKKMLATTAAISLLATAACSSGSSSDSSSKSGDHKSSGPKTVHMSTDQDVDTILPMDSNVGDNIDILSVIYDGLVSYDAKTMEPHNRVASKISSRDKVHWTIKIKKGLKFQNGEPVDSKAFARAWNYAAYGPHAMANNSFFTRIAGYDKMQGKYSQNEKTGKVKVTKKPQAKKLSGLQTPDAHTLKVTLKEPFAGFATMLGYTGYFPVAKACIKDVKKCAKKPIGNGPFKVTKWKQGVKLTAVKWKGYQGDTPNYDRITWRDYNGGHSWPDFESGDLDTGAPPPSEWQKANNDPELKKRRVIQQGVDFTYLGFPLYRKHQPWDKKAFREAVSMAIDRKAIIDQILPGQEVPATSWVPPKIPGGKKGTCKWCHYDPKKAKKLLAKAGGWPKNKTLKIYLGKDNTNEKYFKAIGDQLKRNLGINYSLVPSTDFFAERTARKFKGAYRNNWFADYPLNENYLKPIYYSTDPKKGDPNFGYYDPKFNKAIKKADTAQNIGNAEVRYRKAEQILAKDFPTIPLSISKDVVFYSKRVTNVVIDPFSGSTRLRDLKFVGG